MTNAERQIEKFIKQYPQFEGDRNYLNVNIYCDIIDERKPEGERVIAVSDCKHTLDRMSYELATKWELKH